MDERSQLERLVAEAGVRDTIARFADAGTRCDVASFRELWADECAWSIEDGLQATGIEEITDAFHSVRDGREFFVQLAVPGPIVIDGDEASTTCTCHEAARGPGETYYRNFSLSFDRLRRTGDRWLFTERAFRYLWLDDSAFAGTGFPVPEGPTPATRCAS